MSIWKPTKKEIESAIRLRESQQPSSDVLERVEEVKRQVDAKFGPDGGGSKPK